MSCVDPAEIFQGTIVITVPHMDDCVLSCGGTIAKLPGKERIHVIYATDGMRSPAPVLPWCDSITPDLGVIRMREAREAIGSLAVPQGNIHFLCLPEGRLKYKMKRLFHSLTEVIGQIGPAHILMPFRYDCHSDHLALNRVVVAAHKQGVFQAELTEYFVYYRWRLLPQGDVRKYITPEHLLEVNIDEVSAQKRAALDCFKSQTTRFYRWQSRATLSPQLLAEVSQTPEFFLRYDPSLQGAAVFRGAVPWIRIAHRLEPVLKKNKDRVVALWRRGLQNNG